MNLISFKKNQSLKKKKSLKKNFILFLIFTPILLYFFPTALGGDADFVSVFGNSMLPTIKPGSVVIIKSQLDYELGEIVAFHHPDSGDKIVHRIIEVHDDGFTIKGDNNEANDPGPISHEEIIGEAIFVMPNIGHALILLKNPIVLVLVSASIYILPNIKKWIKKEKPKKIKKETKQEKKQEIVLNFAGIAIISSIIFFAVMQIGLVMGEFPQLDPITRPIQGVFEPFIASTFSFSFWFLILLSAYFVRMKYQNIKILKNSIEGFFICFIIVELYFTMMNIRHLIL